MLDVCLLGTGGMMPLPYRWLTSLMLRFEGHQILIDCGEGTQIAAKKAGMSFKPIDVICLTHYHADHVTGLTGMLLTMGNAERKEPVLVIGPKGLDRVIGAVRTVAPELPFPLELAELTEKEQDFEVKGMKIHAFRVSHNVPCYGYSVEIPRAGKFQVDRAQALELPVRLWNPLQKGRTVEYEGVTYTSDQVMGPARRGLKVTYCTDSRPTASIAQAAQGADLFICEGMYGDPEKQEKAVEHKHMTFEEAGRLAKSAGPRQMWLTHFGPAMNHPEDYLDRARQIFPRTRLGRDGKKCTLKFPADSQGEGT